MTRVALASGRRVRDQMSEPYADTLYTYLQISEHERIAGFGERSRQLYAGSLVAMAFNEPRKLAAEHRRLMTDIGAGPTREEALAKGERIIAAMRAVEARAKARRDAEAS